MKIKLSFLLGILLVGCGLGALEVVIDVAVYNASKDITPAVRPANFKNYDVNIPYYTFGGKGVVAGYEDQAVAKTALDIVFAREDQILTGAGVVPTAEKKSLHLKIVTGATADEAVKTVPGGKLVGDVFNIAGKNGIVLKKDCYLVVAKAAQLTSGDLAAALDAMYTAVAGSGL